MAILVTSQPVDSPAGIRFVLGKIDFNGTTYGTGGLAVSVAQWGGASVGQSRQPDFVIFSAGSADASDVSTSATTFRYLPATGKVAKYGDEPLVDQGGQGEGDAAASSAETTFLAIWVTGGVAVVA